MRAHTDPRTCAWCERTLPAESTSRRRFCSSRCRSAHWYWRERRRRWNRKRAVHEAGHYVVAKELGRNVRSWSMKIKPYSDPRTGEPRISGGRIELSPLRTRRGSGSRRRCEDLEGELVILAAGAVAMKLRDCLTREVGDRADFEEAYELAQELLGSDASTEEVEARVRAAIVEATEILMRERDLLEDVASYFEERAE